MSDYLRIVEYTVTNTGRKFTGIYFDSKTLVYSKNSGVAVYWMYTSRNASME